MAISQQFVIFCLTLLVAASGQLEATSLISRPVGALSRDAREIYRVRIIDKEYKKVGRQVWTEYRAQILEPLKGDTPSGQVVALHLPGGREGTKDFKVLGLPEIQKDQEYVVFLRDSLRSEGLHRLTDWSAFVVGRDQRGERYVMSVGSSQSSHSRNTAIHAAEYSNVRSYDGFMEDVFLNIDN